MLMRHTERFPPNPVALFARLASGISRVRTTDGVQVDEAWTDWLKEESARISRMEERIPRDAALRAFDEKMGEYDGVTRWYYRMLERESDRRGDPEFLSRHKVLFGRAVLDQRGKRKT